MVTPAARFSSSSHTNVSKLRNKTTLLLYMSLPPLISPSRFRPLLLTALQSLHITNRFSTATVTMAAASNMFSDLDAFHAHLQKSTRVLALLGAGVSASSGLPTFRGAGGLWRNHDATALATPGAFEHDPALVWRFYSCEFRLYALT